MLGGVRRVVFVFEIGLAKCIFDRIRKKGRTIEVCDGNIVKPEEICCCRGSSVKQGDGMLYLGSVERREVCFSPHATV